VKGEWCPGFPDLPLVGKLSQPSSLPTFSVKVEENGDILISN